MMLTTKITKLTGMFELKHKQGVKHKPFHRKNLERCRASNAKPDTYLYKLFNPLVP